MDDTSRVHSLDILLETCRYSDLHYIVIPQNTDSRSCLHFDRVRARRWPGSSIDLTEYGGNFVSPFDLSTCMHSGELLVVRIRDTSSDFAGAPIATVTPTEFEGWQFHPHMHS